jgi:azurin
LDIDGMIDKPLLVLFTAILSLLHVPGAYAQIPEACTTVVTVNDHLYFKPDQIEIPSQCDQFTVVLQHEGRLPKIASPRNWVLTSARDANVVARDASAAGASQDWVTPNDPRVLAHSAVIGRQEAVSISVPVQDLMPGEPYVYLCTIPGFSPTMRGQLILQP